MSYRLEHAVGFYVLVQGLLDYMKVFKPKKVLQQDRKVWKERLLLLSSILFAVNVNVLQSYPLLVQNITGTFQEVLVLKNQLNDFPDLISILHIIIERYTSLFFPSGISI